MDKNLDIKLLIGPNCLKALEPQEVISSQGDGPYDFKTKFGWCIVRPISDGSYQNNFHCKRIIVEDHATGRITKHHFAILKDVKEDGISDLLKELYTADFMENQTLPSNGINKKLTELSAEDTKFLKLMDEGCTKSDVHYQLPLPFRNSEVDLPNNKWLAERRLQCLKKKLQKDEKFCTHYIAFMDDLFNKGLATKSTGIQASSSWYIPHHVVFHLHKPDKIRVVFDCGSEFQGRSLKKKLLSKVVDVTWLTGWVKPGEIWQLNIWIWILEPHQN